MFNLEQAIADWRQKMLAAGIEAPVPLQELELHLREEVERQVGKGMKVEEAFILAVKCVGAPRNLQAEFKKIPARPIERAFQVFCAMFLELAGCLFCLHGIWQLLDIEFSFAYIGGGFSFENLLVGPLASLTMGMGSLAFGAWLIWRGWQSLMSANAIIKIMFGSAVIAFGIILATFLLPNLAKITHDSLRPTHTILLLEVIPATTCLGLLLTALINPFKQPKDRPPLPRIS